MRLVSPAAAAIVLAHAACARQLCEPWCTDPCAKLNGDVTHECNGCDAVSGARCHPGAPGYKALTHEDDGEGAVAPPPREDEGAGDRIAMDGGRWAVGADGELEEQPRNSSDGGGGGAGTGEEKCMDRLPRECQEWVEKGACESQRLHMLRVCAKTCQLCGTQAAARSPCGSGRAECHDRLSLFDERVSGDFGATAACPPVARLLQGAHRCEDLHNEARVRDRGYYVLRGAVPPAELQAMADFVASLPHKATRLLCGASDVQPDACKLGGDELARLYPATHGAVVALFRKWIDRCDLPPSPAFSRHLLPSLTFPCSSVNGSTAASPSPPSSAGR